MKRLALVPRDAYMLAEKLSKADLLEVAWSLASLCNNGESADDDPATFARLIEEVNAIRENQSRKPVKAKVSHA